MLLQEPFLIKLFGKTLYLHLWAVELCLVCKRITKSSEPIKFNIIRSDVMKLKMAGKLDVTTTEGVKHGSIV
jgi:hypothetical protein